MEIKQEQRGGVSVLAPLGRLDTDSASDFELALQDLLAAGAQHFVVDLGEINYVSSAGLRVLLMLAKRVEGKGSLRLADLNPQVKQVFDVAGFTKLFSIFPSASAALDRHPGAGEVSPALAKLAAKLMGAGDANAKPDADDARMAKAAAGILGVAPTPTPLPPSKTPPAKAKKTGDKTMALASLKTPVGSGEAPASASESPSAAPEPKRGFFARLLGLFKR